MLSEAELKRLRWRCAERSMREMDVLLGSFFETYFTKLNEAEQSAFARLAEKEDPLLWAMITGKKACEDVEEAKMIALLKQNRLV